VKVLYLDESGDHNLRVIDPLYPVFVLGGVLIDEEYAAGEMEEEMRRFKRELFGRDDLILHTADITRNRNGFEQLKDSAFRARFYERLNELVRALRFEVLACAVKKRDYVQRHGISAADPYTVGLGVLVEQLCHVVGDVEQGGRIIAEKRGPELDRQLDLSWETLKVRGAGEVTPRTVRERIADLVHRHKRENVAGLQLADLVVTPIGRHVLGKRVHEDFRVVEEKLRRKPATGDYLGVGLTVLPES
jgi:hypothetical protein